MPMHAYVYHVLTVAHHMYFLVGKCNRLIRLADLLAEHISSRFILQF